MVFQVTTWHYICRIESLNGGVAIIGREFYCCPVRRVNASKVACIQCCHIRGSEAQYRRTGCREGNGSGESSGKDEYVQADRNESAHCRRAGKALPISRNSR